LDKKPTVDFKKKIKESTAAKKIASIVHQAEMKGAHLKLQGNIAQKSDQNAINPEKPATSIISSTIKVREFFEIVGDLTISIS
jgi:hypothetical protein